jgi:hypothetical protein
MQMGLPELALAALNNVMKLYPNRFNSIANAAAAAAALESSASPPSMSPTASSLYAQLLALADLAPSLRAASRGLPGKSLGFFAGIITVHSVLFICIVQLPHPPSSSRARRTGPATRRLRRLSCCPPPSRSLSPPSFLLYLHRSISILTSPSALTNPLPAFQFSLQRHTSNQTVSPIDPPPPLPSRNGTGWSQLPLWECSARLVWSQVTCGVFRPIPQIWLCSFPPPYPFHPPCSIDQAHVAKIQPQEFTALSGFWRAHAVI